MTTHYRTFKSAHLSRAWSLLNEYNDFCSLARHRKKLEEQIQAANIPLTNVPWKSMVHAILCLNLFSEEQLKEMNTITPDCCTRVDIAESEDIINFLIENRHDNKKNFTETWFELGQLKQCFQQAFNFLPASHHKRKEMIQKILGYPTGYSDEETTFTSIDDDQEPFDLTNILTIDEQKEMHTGDLIEFSGLRLHDAFYIYRLPVKGLWTQIQQMWSKHEIIDFKFNDLETQSEEEQEIILIPAMDEYGYGVPYLFATKPTESLPDGTYNKYVDINCPLVSMQQENPTIALVQQNLNERLKSPVYHDTYIDNEMSVELDRFPHEYIASVTINHRRNDNVIWLQRIHYNGHDIARDLNDNLEIFFSRRILECEEQYRQRNKNINTTTN